MHLAASALHGPRAACRPRAAARTPGRSSVAARKLAPRDTSFLLKFQPNTPPPPAYRVPVTMSASLSACLLIKSGMYFGCAPRTASSPFPGAEMQRSAIPDGNGSLMLPRSRHTLHACLRIKRCWATMKGTPLEHACHETEYDTQGSQAAQQRSKSLGSSRISGRGHTWCERSASMTTTKLPVAKRRPCT